MKLIIFLECTDILVWKGIRICLCDRTIPKRSYVVLSLFIQIHKHTLIICSFHHSKLIQTLKVSINTLNSSYLRSNKEYNWTAHLYCVLWYNTNSLWHILLNLLSPTNNYFDQNLKFKRTFSFNYHIVLFITNYAYNRGLARFPSQLLM